MADAHYPNPRIPAPRGGRRGVRNTRVGALLLGTRLGGIIGVGVVMALLLALSALPVVVPSGALVRDTAKRLGDFGPAPKPGTLAQRSNIYAANGARLATLFDENRVYLPLKKIPKFVRDAVVAIEDDRFYEHSGIDWRGIARAAIADLKAGSIEQGGSTLTQQYVKKIVLNDTSQTLDRKVREAALAVQLEKEMTKGQILEAYLNAVAFGEGTYGVAAAAQHYFGGKSVSKLTLAEAASLAATIKSPEVYKPTRPKANLPRRDLVLDRMQELGFAKPRDVAKAKKAALRTKSFKLSVNQPFFVDYVRGLLLNDHAYDKALGKVGSERRKKMVFQGGLKIYTTLDSRRQREAEASVREQLRAPSQREGRIDGALASVDPKTGRIVALVSGKDYKKSKVNLATLGNGSGGMQPGSSFKTFFVVAALEEGLPTTTTFFAPPEITDEVGDKCPGWGNGKPGNADPAEAGNYNLYTATIHSVNTYFAQLAVKVGPSRGLEVARRMGISNAPKPPGPDASEKERKNYSNWNVCSLVLGAKEVSVLDMASAYGTLANQGVHCEAYSIDRIIGPDGKALFKQKADCHQVVEPGIANQTVDILRDVVTSGTGRAAALAGRPVAGKTGTTDEYRSAFFNGFTPQLATSVWVGIPRKPTPMRTLGPTGGPVFGGTWPARIFQQYMQTALTGQPVESFPAPPHGRPPDPAQKDEKGVPDVQGKPLAEAVAILRAAGFGAAPRPVHERAPIGQVVRQSPKAGSNAKPGTVVVLYVSDGLGGGRGGGGGGGGGDGPSPTG
ncbi:MAG TPA: transglycosylase domain-containing protein [Actinomycetes bacterium]|jgi:membrane peptidoglycan carboxypeptidase|nr:transglycosylase domain-containing protein [Actinomycetes bacterium]